LQREINYEEYLDEWRIPVGNPKDGATMGYLVRTLLKRRKVSRQ